MPGKKSELSRNARPQMRGRGVATAVARGGSDGAARPFMHRQRAKIRDDALRLRWGEIASGGHRRASHSITHHRGELRVGALRLPTERADLRRQTTQCARQCRVTVANHAMTLRASLSENPLAFGHLRPARAQGHEIGNDVPTLVGRELGGESGHWCAGDTNRHDPIEQCRTSTLHSLCTTDRWWFRVEGSRCRTISHSAHAVTRGAALLVYRAPRHHIDRTIRQLERSLTA